MLFSVPVRDRREEGLVLRLQKVMRGNYHVRELGEALSPEPLITRRGLALARWLARYYVCPLNRAAALFLPPAIRPVQEIRYYANQEDSVLFIDPAWLFLWEGIKKAGEKGMAEQRITRRWNRQATQQAEEWVSSGYLRKETGFRQERKGPRKEAMADMMLADLSLRLSPDQQNAFDRIKKDIQAGVTGRHLLFGVTGSGKTEVYLRLASFVRELGKQTIYLVPEISLVPQLAAKALSWVYHQVAILHSNLTPSKRNTEKQRIKSGEVRLIIGPRSALFAPVENLGLIIIDEEHEHTFKQNEPEPRYDARKTAEVLARLNKAVVVRGSATPDIESLYRTENHEIALSVLPNRITQRQMPPITWIDMKKEMLEGRPYPVSQQLLMALEDRKRKGEQAILLLNRRGYHNYVLCRDCGKTMECPHCSIPLTYHRSVNTANSSRQEKQFSMLICHYCGYQSAMWEACTRCGGKMLQYMGTGTQRVMDYLQKEIPSLSLLRLDVDSTARAGSHNEILKTFQEGKADVLVGTQMVAKGFDFPKVTLSAVLHIDGIINLPDYQGSERALQLILQTAGRAGRGDIPGEVMVQTFYPDNPILKIAGSYDYMLFYQNELALRKTLDYPPVKKSARVLVTGSSDEDVKDRLDELTAYCKQNLEEEDKKAITWLGPSQAPVEKIRNRWRRHLILLADRWAPLAHCLQLIKGKSAVWGDEPRIIMDMDPKSYL